MTPSRRVGSKAGKLGAKGAKLGKGGAVLKGASTLGALAAARSVFVHVADDAGRVALFVADERGGALKVVTRGGDEAVHTADSFRRAVDDLDEMGRAVSGAGVDLYLDPSALRRLEGLPIGERTRLFLANTDGPSWPVRRAADGVAEVAVAERTWLRVGAEVGMRTLDLALRLGSLPLEADSPRVVVDPDCDGAVEPSVALAGAAEGQTVVLLGQDDVDPAELVAMAQAHDIDLVWLGLADVCPPGQPEPPAPLLADLHQASTVADLWSLATGDRPVQFEDVKEASGRIMVVGAGVVSSFALPEEEAEDPVPEWAKPYLGFLVLLAFLAYFRWQHKRAKAAPA